MVLICILLMTRDTEQLFMCLLAIYIFSMEKSLFRSFVQFSIRLSFYCWVIRVLSVKTPLSDIWAANIFSRSISCLFTFLMVFFEELRFLILMISRFSWMKVSPLPLGQFSELYMVGFLWFFFNFSPIKYFLLGSPSSLLHHFRSSSLQYILMS